MEDAKHLWEIMITGAIAVISFFGSRTITSIDKIDEKVDRAANDLHSHKTHVAESYSTNETIKRVHDRIDDLGKKIDNQADKIMEAILNNK